MKVIVFLILSLAWLTESVAGNSLITPIALPKIPQNAKYYISGTGDSPLIERNRQLSLAKGALQRYFFPWSNPKPDTSYIQAEQQQILKLYETHTTKYFSYNFHRITPDWLSNINEQMNWRKFPNMQSNGIVIQNTYLRDLPTSLPIYDSYREAGQGYPFDNLQISALWVGRPIFIHHLSRDGAWALVSDHSASGWVRTTDIAYVNSWVRKKIQQNPLVVITKDHIPIKNAQGRFLFYSHIGMLFPVIHGKIRVPVKNENDQAVLIPINISKNIYKLFPIPATEKNFSLLINRMLGQPYGWGGMYYQRDCSLTMQDLFIGFGILLPRNSGEQSNAGQKISLQGLTDKEKNYLLKYDAKPFLTLLHMPGHITLYLGKKSGDGIVFQNKWGIATQDREQRKGRAVLGVAHIAPLSFGKKIKYSTTTLIKRVDSMTILGA